MRATQLCVLVAMVVGCNDGKAAPGGATSTSADAGSSPPTFATAEDFEVEAATEYEGITAEKLEQAIGKLEAELP